jgi:hypothetical protein
LVLVFITGTKKDPLLRELMNRVNTNVFEEGSSVLDSPAGAPATCMLGKSLQLLQEAKFRMAEISEYLLT